MYVREPCQQSPPILFFSEEEKRRLHLNRPFPSSKKSHFQNEAKCETFLVKMSFICIIIKNHFHINGLGLSLTLKVRFSELGNGLLRQTFEVAAARTSGLVNLVLSCQTRFCTRLLGLTVTYGENLPCGFETIS